MDFSLAMTVSRGLRWGFICIVSMCPRFIMNINLRKPKITRQMTLPNAYEYDTFLPN